MCVIREHMILQIIFTWSRLTKGWDGLRSFYNLFSCFKSDTNNYVKFFSQLFFEFFLQSDVLNFVI